MTALTVAAADRSNEKRVVLAYLSRSCGKKTVFELATRLSVW